MPLLTESTDQFLQLLHELPQDIRAMIDQRLRPLGISQATWRVLLNLLRLEQAGQQVVQIELARRLGIEGPSLVSLLDRLQREGYVERVPSQQDRRCKRVRLTDRGRTFAAEMRAMVNPLLTKLFDGVPAESLTHCIAVLKRIKENVGV